MSLPILLNAKGLSLYLKINKNKRGCRLKLTASFVLLYNKYDVVLVNSLYFSVFQVILQIYECILTGFFPFLSGIKGFFELYLTGGETCQELSTTISLLLDYFKIFRAFGVAIFNKINTRLVII